MVSAQDLSYSVAFDKRTDAGDGFGNTVSDWAEQFRCRAAYRHLRGGETVISGRLTGRHPQLITVRASVRTRQIDADWRARDTRTGDVFNIRDVTHETDRAWITLLVEKGAA